MTTISFNAPTRFARYIQLLVMKYNGRFVRNPFDMFGTSRFEISFENNDASKLMTMVDILNQPFA